MLLGMIIKIYKFRKFCRADESKNLLFDYCVLIFFPPTEFLKNWFIRIRLILVVTKNLKKIHRPDAEILANKVGKYEKVRKTRWWGGGGGEGAGENTDKSQTT